jgi:transposase InsO family protein
VIESRQTKANESYPSQLGKTRAEIRALRAAGVSQRELMKRYSVSKATIIKYAVAKKKGFKEYAPGLIHIGIKHLSRMPDETSRRYLFVAIDRASVQIDHRLIPPRHPQTNGMVEHFNGRISELLPRPDLRAPQNLSKH